LPTFVQPICGPLEARRKGGRKTLAGTVVADPSPQFGRLDATGMLFDDPPLG
jgi:hypothetical protein